MNITVYAILLINVQVYIHQSHNKKELAHSCCVIEDYLIKDLLTAMWATC